MTLVIFPLYRTWDSVELRENGQTIGLVLDGHPLELNKRNSSAEGESRRRREGNDWFHYLSAGMSVPWAAEAELWCVAHNVEAAAAQEEDTRRIN